MSGSENSNSSSPRYCPTPHQMPVPPCSPPPNAMMHQVMSGHAHAPHGHPHMQAQHSQAMSYYGHYGHAGAAPAQSYYAPAPAQSPNAGYYGMQAHHQALGQPQQPGQHQYVQQQPNSGWPPHVHQQQAQQSYYNHGYPTQTQQIQQNPYAPHPTHPQQGHQQQQMAVTSGGNPASYDMSLTHGLVPPSSHAVLQNHQQHVVNPMDNSGQHALMNLSRFVSSTSNNNPNNNPIVSANNGSTNSVLTPNHAPNNNVTCSSQPNSNHALVDIPNNSSHHNVNNSIGNKSLPIPRPEPIRSPINAMLPLPVNSPPTRPQTPQLLQCPPQQLNVVNVPIPSPSPGLVNTNGGQMGMMPVRLQNMAKGARTKASMRKMLLEQQTTTTPTSDNYEDNIVDEPPKKRVRKKKQDEEELPVNEALVEIVVEKKGKKGRGSGKKADSFTEEVPKATGKSKNNSKSPLQAAKLAAESLNSRSYSPDISSPIANAKNKASPSPSVASPKKRGRKPKNAVVENIGGSNVEEEIAHVLLDLKTGKNSPEKPVDDLINSGPKNDIDRPGGKRKRKSSGKQQGTVAGQAQSGSVNAKGNVAKSGVLVGNSKTKAVKGKSKKKLVESVTEIKAPKKAKASPKKTNKNILVFDTADTSNGTLPAPSYVAAEQTLASVLQEQEFPVIHIPEGQSENMLLVQATTIEKCPGPGYQNSQSYDSMLDLFHSNTTNHISAIPVPSKPLPYAFAKDKTSGPIELTNSDSSVLSMKSRPGVAVKYEMRSKSIENDVQIISTSEITSYTGTGAVGNAGKNSKSKAPKKAKSPKVVAKKTAAGVAKQSPAKLPKTTKKGAQKNLVKSEVEVKVPKPSPKRSKKGKNKKDPSQSLENASSVDTVVVTGLLETSSPPVATAKASPKVSAASKKKATPKRNSKTAIAVIDNAVVKNEYSSPLLPETTPKGKGSAKGQKAAKKTKKSPGKGLTNLASNSTDDAEVTVEATQVEEQDFPVLSIPESDTIIITAPKVIVTKKASPKKRSKSPPKPRSKSPSKQSKSAKSTIPIQSTDSGSTTPGGAFIDLTCSEEMSVSPADDSPAAAEEIPEPIISPVKVEDSSKAAKQLKKKSQKAKTPPRNSSPARSPRKGKQKDVDASLSVPEVDNPATTITPETINDNVVTSSVTESFLPVVKTETPAVGKKSKKKIEIHQELQASAEVTTGKKGKKKPPKVEDSFNTEDEKIFVTEVKEEVLSPKPGVTPVRKRVSGMDRIRLDKLENQTITEVSQDTDKPLPDLEFFYQFEYSQRNNYPPSLPSLGKRKHAIREAARKVVMGDMYVPSAKPVVTKSEQENDVTEIPVSHSTLSHPPENAKSEDIKKVAAVVTDPKKRKSKNAPMPTTQVTGSQPKRKRSNSSNAIDSEPSQIAVPPITFIPSLVQPLPTPTLIVNAAELEKVRAKEQAKNSNAGSKGKGGAKGKKGNQEKMGKNNSRLGPSLRVKNGVVKFYRGGDEEDVDMASSKLRSERPADIFDNKTPWLCSFCCLGPHVRRLGDLFGPYYVNTSPEDFEDLTQGVSSHSKSVMDGYRPVTQTKVKMETWMHQDCALWAGELVMVGTSIRGLDKVVYESASVTCSVCSKTGATIGCLIRGCLQAAHYPCALQKQWILDDDTFHSFCALHKDCERF